VTRLVDMSESKLGGSKFAVGLTYNFKSMSFPIKKATDNIPGRLPKTTRSGKYCLFNLGGAYNKLAQIAIMVMVLVSK
jgi:hypothetical protein